MKKIIIFLAAIMLFAGCTKTQEKPAIDPNEGEANLGEQTQNEDGNMEIEPMPESILISGIITDINDNMVTVEVKEGINDPVVVLKLSDETVWEIGKDLMAVNQFIQAEISPMMTRSIPPQSNALKVISLNDVILGEVTEITDTQITLKPVDFYNHETVIINVSDETKWSVEKGSVSVGHHIRVMVGMQMTMSIPPQVPGIEVLSIETRD